MTVGIMSYLFANKVGNKFSFWTSPEQVLREHRLPETGALRPKPTEGDEERERDRHGQTDWKGKTESLNTDLTGKLPKDVSDIGSEDLEVERISNEVRDRLLLDHFLEEGSAGNIGRGSTIDWGPDLGHIDLMISKGVCELGKCISNIVSQYPD